MRGLTTQLATALRIARPGFKEFNRDASTAISYTVSEVQPCTDRTEPVREEVNLTASSELRNRLTDVALFMNSFPIFISLAGFEGDWYGADGADEARLRRVLGGARHRMILLVDYGFSKTRTQHGCNSATKSTLIRKGLSDRELGAPTETAS
jgi:hypothetical protein